MVRVVNRTIPGKECVIVAEAGVNHNGSVDLAVNLVDAAVDAGADVIKFQTFSAKDEIAVSASKAAYQKTTGAPDETQLEMVRKLELSHRDQKKIFEYCKKRGISFLSTPFELKSADFLISELHLETVKISSGDLTYAPLLYFLAGKGVSVILSTGMSTIGEIEDALGVLAAGYVGSGEGRPNRKVIEDAYCSPQGQASLRKHVVLLHCTTEYPAPFDDVNLACLATLRHAFGLPVGYSDHTMGIEISLAAASMGAVLIEKHLTLDRTLSGPDHKASLTPDEFSGLVSAVRHIERARGDGRKIPALSERKNMSVARKSLVAARRIVKGESFTEGNVTCKRPGYGRSPLEYWNTLGQTAERNYETDEVLD